MSKKKLNISQPLNFRHEGHIGPANNHGQVKQSGNVYAEQTSPSHLALPQPCPGPSIIQNIGSQSLDQSTIDQITRHIKDAVKKELTPLIETITGAISKPTTTKHTEPQYSNTVRRLPLENNSSSEGSTVSDYTSLPVQTPSQPLEPEEDLRIANPTYAIKQENMTSHRSFKERPIPAPRQNREMYRTLPGRLKSKTHANQRDCYAMALKIHIEDIVANCVFDVSNLPDALISGECLTEDECRTMREKVDRKDQIRILVAVIRTRDLTILEKFFTLLGQHNPALKQKIVETVDKYKKEGYREKKCLICKVKSHVSVKYVADRLWAENYIQDDVYNQIIYSEKPVGAQNKLWEEVLDNLARGDNSRRAFTVLGDILRRGGHYGYLADGIKTLLEQHSKGTLECECQLHIRFSTILSVSTVDSNAPNSSDSSVVASSLEIFSDEISRKSTDLHDDIAQKKRTLLSEKQRKEKTKDSSDQTCDVNINFVETTDHPPPLPKKKSTIIEDTTMESSTEDASYV